MGRAPKHEQPGRSLQPSRGRFYDLVRQSPVAAFVATPEGQIVEVNAAGTRLLGYRRKDLRDRQIRELCADLCEWEAIEQGIDKGRRIRDVHLRLNRKDGSQIDCLVASMPVDRHGEKKVRFFFLWDFTTYAEKIRELESAGERHHLFANMEKDSLWTTEFDRDKNLRVTYMSEPIANIMGYTAREIKDMSLEQMVMPSSAKTAAESYERQLRIDGKKGVAPSRSWSIEFELRHKNGHPVWVEAKSTFMRDRHGKPIGIIGFTRDVTERRRYETQLKALSSSLVEMQEMERRHIARELHDQIGQSLTGIRMLLGMLPEHLPKNAGKIVGEIQTVIDDVMNRVKDLCLELRPSTLDDLGLLPTLLRHFQTYKTQTNVDVHFKQKGLEKRFDPAIETAVFRIVQEGLTNVARHAKVCEVDIRIVVTKNKVRIQIDDSGRGFAREAVYASGTASGIVGMRERAALLGGHLSVESAPGIGTRVAAEIPLKNSPEASAAR
jgi:PAS domain S-box-containing protein